MLAAGAGSGADGHDGPEKDSAQPEAASPPAGQTAPSASDWVQAYDSTSGHCYYYCEALQQTQWDPPAHFVPMDMRGWPAFEGMHTRFDEDGNAVAVLGDAAEVSGESGAGPSAADSVAATAGEARPPGSRGAAGGEPTSSSSQLTAAAADGKADRGGSASAVTASGDRRHAGDVAGSSAEQHGTVREAAGPSNSPAEEPSASGRAEIVRADGGAFASLPPAEVAEALSAGCDADMHKYWWVWMGENATVSHMFRSSRTMHCVITP